MKTNDEHRSRCPINLSLEVLGDRWSLLILRDMVFAGKRHFRELLRSEEGISSNILADRLGKLSEEGMVTKDPDPTHKRKAIYSLTEKSIALVPVFVQLGVWGSTHLSASEELSASAWVLEKGGPRMWERFMSELREEHIGPSDGGGSDPGEVPVTATLRAAYEEVVARGADPSAALESAPAVLVRHAESLHHPVDGEPGGGR
jgi:DNA-binding HxlR family transcriptional regulator